MDQGEEGGTGVLGDTLPSPQLDSRVTRVEDPLLREVLRRLRGGLGFV